MLASGIAIKKWLSCVGPILLIGCSAEERSTPAPSGSVQETATVSEVEEKSASRRLDYQGHIFLVPKEHILSQRSGKDGEFVRLRLPGSPADIVLDGLNVGKRDDTGLPIVFSVNDGPYPGVTRLDRSEGAVVCRTGMAAQSGCGTKFDFAGAEVTLLFPMTKRDEVDVLIQKATRALDQVAVGGSLHTSGVGDRPRSTSD